MEKVYIFGHKKPDTDSVTASIALSYLKNRMGMNTEARTLGDVNRETNFALRYFNVPEPRYLNDVKLQVKDTLYLHDYYLNKKMSLYDGFVYMKNNGIGILPIIDDSNKFDGLVLMTDLAEYQIKDTLHTLETSYQHLLEVLNGEEILKFDDELKINNVSTELDNSDGIITNNIKGINNQKLIVITDNADIDPNYLETAKNKRINIIKTKLNVFATSRKIWLANYLYTLKMHNNVMCFREDDSTDEVIEKTKKSKYSNYPVLDKKNRCLGLLRVSDINEAVKKKVILVDHNEPDQSVDGLEEAEILEIIDHHKIGTLGTSMPINFRNMPVGSSNTIVYMLYKENHIEIPKNIAGIMLSGIISDTLLFKSPTTTEIDKMVVKELSIIAGVNYEEYGISMLKEGCSTKGKSMEDILFTDFKNFTIENKKIGIGQITTFDINEFLDNKQNYIDMINKITKYKEYDIIALFATDIIKDGSYIFFNDEAKETFELAFDIENIEEGHFLNGIISRKKQIIPNIIDVLDKK